MKLVLVLLLIALVQCITAEWDFFPQYDDKAVADITGMFAELSEGMNEDMSMSAEAGEEESMEVDAEVEEEEEEGMSAATSEDAFVDDRLFSCGKKCAKGKKAVSSGRRATSNGCGPNGKSWISKIFSKTLNSLSPAGFRSCCDTHDIGYGTCGSNRSTVDKAFGACLTRALNAMKAKKVQTDAEKRCIRFRLDKVFYAGVAAGGCGPFTTAQGQACSCK